MLPSPPLLNRIAKFALLIQFEIDWLGFTLAAIFELTREVSLPDQSVRIVKAARNLSKRYLSKYLWKPVNACGRCAKKSVAHRNAIAVFAPPVAPSLRGGVFIPRPASLRNRHHPERSFARCCLSRGVCARETESKNLSWMPDASPACYFTRIFLLNCFGTNEFIYRFAKK